MRKTTNKDVLDILSDLHQVNHWITRDKYPMMDGSNRMPHEKAHKLLLSTIAWVKQMGNMWQSADTPPDDDREVLCEVVSGEHKHAVCIYDHEYEEWTNTSDRDGEVIVKRWKEI